MAGLSVAGAWVSGGGAGDAGTGPLADQGYSSGVGLRGPGDEATAGRKSASLMSI